MRVNDTTAGVGTAENEQSSQRRVHITAEEEYLKIVDPIERRQDRIETRSRPDPTPVDADTMGAPVDTAVSVTLERLAFDRLCRVFVRDLKTGSVTQVAEGSDQRFDPGRYRLEIASPVKLYVELTASFTVRTDDRTRIDLSRPTTVTVGARSMHQRPAATMTVPADPEAMLQAVSGLGTALKTTSPERSWPTLRGHPPAIEIGDRLAIPTGIEPPVPEIEIAVPPTYRHAYVVAPLAFYLGARVVPGDPPTIRTRGGFEHRLDEPHGFEAGVERTLRRILFLDCVVRSVGLYQFPVKEVLAVEDDLSLDRERLYDAPPTERFREYVSIPYDRVADQIPDWEVTSYVDTRASQAELLPYLLNDLTIIKTKPGRDGSVSTERAVEQATSISSIIRGETERNEGVELTLPDHDESIGTNWAGQGIPARGNKVTKQAFENQFETEPTDPPISAVVVCNESEMDEEVEDVDDVYDPDLPFPFEVDVRRGLTRREFRRVLTRPTEFLHFVGHCEPEGLSCADGFLDIADVPDVNVESFLLNACSSYEQGLAMIDRGAVGGVVTHSDVLDSTASRVGPVIARMLNAGYSLRVALDVAEGATNSNRYLILGNGGHSVVQRDGSPLVCDIDRVDENTYSVKIESYFSAFEDVGAAFRPFLDQFDYHLLGNTTDRVEVSENDLEEWIWRGQFPVRIGGELRWNTLLSLEDC